MAERNKKLIVILGPTATGKTKLAVALARRFGGEIISADSRQVYKGMDIGTGKDLAEYGLKRPSRASGGASGRAKLGSKMASEVPFSLIDVISPKTEYNVAKYQKAANRAIRKAISGGRLPFLVGGTGLYIDAVARGYKFTEPAVGDQKKLKSIRNRLDKLSLPQLLRQLEKIDPASFAVIDRKNRRRVQRALEIFYQSGKTKSESDKRVPPDFEVLFLGLKFPLAELYRRINRRLSERLKEGMIKEVELLRRQGVSWKRLDGFGLEYRFVSRHLRGLISAEELEAQLKTAIHKFAKRQLTWFKRHNDIKWISSAKQAEAAIKEFLVK